MSELLLVANPFQKSFGCGQMIVLGAGKMFQKNVGDAFAAEKCWPVIYSVLVNKGCLVASARFYYPHFPFGNILNSWSQLALLLKGCCSQDS